MIPDQAATSEMERTETKYGSIAVELKDSTVRAGEALCGTVIITAREPIAEFSAVRVVIVGVAQTQICKGALRDRQKLDGSEQGLPTPPPSLTVIHSNQ